MHGDQVTLTQTLSLAGRGVPSLRGSVPPSAPGFLTRAFQTRHKTITPAFRDAHRPFDMHFDGLSTALRAGSRHAPARAACLGYYRPHPAHRLSTSGFAQSES